MVRESGDMREQLQKRKSEEDFARAADILSNMQGKSLSDREAALKRQGISKQVIPRVLGIPGKPENARPSQLKSMLNNYRELYLWIQNHKKITLFLTIPILALLLFFTQQVVEFFIIILFMLLAWGSTAYKRALGIPAGGFELYTLTTLLVGMAYGPWVGGIYGAIAVLGASIMSRDIGPLTPPALFSWGIMGVIAGFNPDANIAVMGMILITINHLTNQLPLFLVGDIEVKYMSGLYVSTNLICNAIMFFSLGPRILALLV